MNGGFISINGIYLSIRYILPSFGFGSGFVIVAWAAANRATGTL